MSRLISSKPKLLFSLCATLILCVCGTVFLPAPARGATEVQPLLVIERVTAERAVAGSQFYLTVVVKNMGDFPAFNVFAQVKSPKFQGNEIFKLAAIATQEEPHLALIEAGETRSFSFSVNVHAEAEDKDYTMGVTLLSQDAYLENDAVPRTSTNTTIKVNYDITQPSLTVKKVILDPARPAGTEPFTATFYLENLSGAEAQNVIVALDGQIDKQENFQVLDTTNTKFVASVKRGKEEFVHFRLRGVRNRPGGSVNIKFNYEYQGNSLTAEQLVNLPLETAAPGTAPCLTISSFTLGETSQEQEYRLRLTLNNLGEEEARDVFLTFDGGSKIYVLQGSNVDHLPAVAGKGSRELEYLLGINRAEGDTHLPLNVKLEYKDTAGNILDPVTETLGLAAADLSKASAAGEPRVLISKYTLSAEKILAGNVVTLNLFIDNTHTRPVKNIKVSLGVAQVEGTTAGTTASAGTVFSPVAGSNSFFVDNIPARATLERSVDLYVDPNATAKTYIVPVTIEYEDEQAKGYKVEEMVNIPVTQESKLQVLSVEIPPPAFIGQPTFIGAEFVNVGKVDLGNFIVMLEGDFPKEQATYYVGNLQIGASDYYQGIIYPEQEGTLEGELIFSYLDNNNQEVQVKEPFKLEVQPAGEMHGPMDGEMPPGMMGPNGPEGPGGGARKWLYCGIVIAVIIALTVLILRRRRARKAREELLDA